MHFEIFSSQSVIAREDREVGMITIRLTVDIMETIRTLTYLLILADTTLNRRWIYDHINNQLLN